VERKLGAEIWAYWLWHVSPTMASFWTPGPKLKKACFSQSYESEHCKCSARKPSERAKRFYQSLVMGNSWCPTNQSVSPEKLSSRRVRFPHGKDEW
jgi:hypothetical protein